MLTDRKSILSIVDAHKLKRRPSVAKLKNALFCGDALKVLAMFPDECVQSVITSPPYYGQRDYGQPNQIGHESNPADYILKLAAVMDEVFRVLKDNGTLWLNLGDKYLSDGNLAGLPWRVALALQDRGWILRSDIIWHKSNAMPQSVKNRPTTDHEYLFLLTKKRDYYYDADSIREPHVTFSEDSKMRGGRRHFGKAGGTPELGKNKGNANLHRGRWDQAFHENGRNKRTVWTIPLSKFPGAHFAVFPEKLIEPCVLAGSKEGDLILDPFFGTGTTAVQALKHKRFFLGVDCNYNYLQMASQRISQI